MSILEAGFCFGGHGSVLHRLVHDPQVCHRSQHVCMQWLYRAYTMKEQAGAGTRYAAAQGEEIMRLSVIDAERCTGCQICMFACTRRLGYAGMGKTAIHVKSVGGMERGLSVVVCRACEDPPCAKVCPEDALVLRKGGGVLLNPSKCTGAACAVRRASSAPSSGTRKRRSRSSACIAATVPSTARMECWRSKNAARRFPMLPNDPLANVLYVDLSKKRSWVERREDLFGRYFGGAGVAIQLLTENCPAGMDPLAPEAPIILATGPLDGLFPWDPRPWQCSSRRTPATWASRMQVAAVPSQYACRASGNRHHRRKCQWGYLSIEGGKAHFRDATTLWGMSSSVTAGRIHTAERELVGLRSIMRIGRAGETWSPMLTSA